MQGTSDPGSNQISQAVCAKTRFELDLFVFAEDVQVDPMRGSRVSGEVIVTRVVSHDSALLDSKQYSPGVAPGLHGAWDWWPRIPLDPVTRIPGLGREGHRTKVPLRTGTLVRCFLNVDVLALSRGQQDLRSLLRKHPRGKEQDQRPDR